MIINKKRIFHVLSILISITTFILYSIKTKSLLESIDFPVHIILLLFNISYLILDFLGYDLKHNIIIFPGGLFITFFIDIFYSYNKLYLFILPNTLIICKFWIYSQLTMSIIHLSLLKTRPFFSLFQGLWSIMIYLIIGVIVIIFHSENYAYVLVNVFTSIVFGAIISYIFLNFSWYFGPKRESLINN